MVPVALLEAREEAARIVRDAEARARATRDELERALRAAAEVEARAALAAEYVMLERARRRMLSDCEATVRELALAVARRVVAQELDAHPERIRGVVRDAVERVRRAARVRVRVSPEDSASLAELGLELVTDPEIERGGCVVESDLGEVDARVEVKLSALARALEEGR